MHGTLKDIPPLGISQWTESSTKRTQSEGSEYRKKVAKISKKNKGGKLFNAIHMGLKLLRGSKVIFVNGLDRYLNVLLLLDEILKRTLKTSV